MKKNERAAALDIGYLMMRAGFTREQVLEVIRIKNENADKSAPKPDIRETDWRLVETGYRVWKDAAARLRQLKEAGYHGAAVDMGDHVNVVIDGGKRGLPIEGVPANKLN